MRSTNSGHVDKVVASLRLSSQIVRTISGVGSETGWNGFRSTDGFTDRGPEYTASPTSWAQPALRTLDTVNGQMQITVEAIPNYSLD